jgi:predicted DCC family thiol-disulfide oxidoreductase YuxK
VTPMIVDRENSADSIERENPETRWVVVFDGSCGYCRRQIDRMRARDADGALEFLPRDAEGILERFPALSKGDFNTGMRVISPEGRLFVGADGVYQIARRLSGWRRWAWVYRVPGLRGILRLAYGWIAKNRYRLSGSATACRVNEPK